MGRIWYLVYYRQLSNRTVSEISDFICTTTVMCQSAVVSMYNEALALQCIKIAAKIVLYDSPFCDCYFFIFCTASVSQSISHTEKDLEEALAKILKYAPDRKGEVGRRLKKPLP